MGRVLREPYDTNIAGELTEWSGGAVAGGVVALGKFDALHVGHRALAERAAELGAPFLVSFAGMAQVLGWEVRYGVALSSQLWSSFSYWLLLQVVGRFPCFKVFPNARRCSAFGVLVCAYCLDANLDLQVTSGCSVRSASCDGPVGEILW